MAFNRIKSLGWSQYETLTSAQMTQLDINASKATDSTYVKDYGAALFFPKSISVSAWNRVMDCVYIQKSNLWLGVDNAGACKTVGASAVIASTTFPAGLNNVLLAKVAYDGNDVIVVGGNPTASTAAKMRRTTVSGGIDIWTTQSVSTVNTDGVIALGFFPAVSLFCAGFSGTGIDTSPDAITWTRRSSSRVSSFAFSPTIAVGIQDGGGGASTGYVTSNDGFTWTARTFPVAATTAYQGVVYSPVDGQFLVIAGGGDQYLRSPDGINWTAFVPTFAASVVSGVSPTRIGLLGGMYLAAYNNGSVASLMASVDKGSTWKPLIITSAVSARALGTSNGQVLFVDSDNANFSNMLSL